MIKLFLCFHPVFYLYQSEDKMRMIASQLLASLYYLHFDRILHRDIKPQKILLTSDGIIKLCDFGYARSMDLNIHMLTSVKGTPLYMATEIIEKKTFDPNASFIVVNLVFV